MSFEVRGFEEGASLGGQLAQPQVLDTVQADSVGNGGAVIPKKRRHVFLRQPPISNLITVTPGTASDQGVGQHPQAPNTAAVRSRA